MKTNSIIQKTFIVITLIFITSCVPEDMKQQMSEVMKESQKMFADREFKKALGEIELYKLRNGKYPNSLRELEFLSAMDSSMFTYIEYIPMDSVYELNINFNMPTFEGGRQSKIRLKYPRRFWSGLGCVKSNAM